MNTTILDLKKEIPLNEYNSFLQTTSLNHVSFKEFFIYPAYFKELLSSLDKKTFTHIFDIMDKLKNIKEIRIENDNYYDRNC